jgi:hypothetical protein
MYSNIISQNNTGMPDAGWKKLCRLRIQGVKKHLIPNPQQCMTYRTVPVLLRNTGLILIFSNLDTGTVSLVHYP